MSSKSKKRPPSVTINKAIRAALTMFLWAYCEIHDPDTDTMERMSREIQNVQESVATGRLSIRDIEEALYDERGWKIL